jgi:AbiV family abortive infection protein
LFRRTSYGSALALSVLAVEEIGKFCIVDNVVFQSVLNGPWTADEQAEWLRAMFDHRVKQSQFGGMAERILAKDVLSRIWGGGLERDKQRGVYVSLPRRGKGVDMGGRLSAPRHVGRVKAEQQITMVSDCLITMCVGCSSDVYLFDVDDVQEGLTLELARRLVRQWPRMGAEARAFIRTVNPGWWKTRPRLPRKHGGA